MNNKEVLFTVLRLYLIRHGETEANVRGIVVGNSESPLTTLGLEQAKELGRTSAWLRNQKYFHRIYSSDLERAKETAALLLGELQAAEATSTISPDGGTEPLNLLQQSVEYTPELRELARGPRQGFSKHLSIDEAIETRKQLQMAEPFPLLETEDDGWDRMSKWLGRQISAAIDETTTAGSFSMFHVLAIGHAGIFRAFLTLLIGKQVLFAHPSAKFDPDGRFSVPNTSLTILDIHLDPTEKPENRIKKIDVILLTSTEHYSSVLSY